MGNPISPGAGASRRFTSPTHIQPTRTNPGSAPERSLNPQRSRPGSTGPSRTAGFSISKKRTGAGTQGDPIIEEMKKGMQQKQRSLFNGFKLMSPNVQDAIQQAGQLFPANIHGVHNPLNQGERVVVFHDLGQERLVPGPINVGTQSAAIIPKDLYTSTARVTVHSHPYTGKHLHYEPSMADQIMARRNPDAEHVVQTPALRGENQYFIFSGAVPPRYYRLLPNPDNLPVPPNSPDRGMPIFRQRPEAGG